LEIEPFNQAYINELTTAERQPQRHAIRYVARLRRVSKIPSSSYLIALREKSDLRIADGPIIRRFPAINHFHRTSPITRTNMSESGEVEVVTAAYPVLPKEVSDEIGSIKLFNKWSYEDVEVKDISLT
jgi:hypothetical protein